jgi:clathrin heavy chain
MESDKFICVKDTASAQQGGKPKLKIVNLTSNAVQEFPMGADSAIMNPMSQIVAVRSGGKLRTLNLELQSNMKGHTMPQGQNIHFWRWLTPKVIGFVTDSHAWLWSMDGDSAPVQAFERHGSLSGTQVIDFQISSNNKWLLLVGIKKGNNGGIDGNMQLYSVSKKVSQPLQGHAGTFANVKVNGEKEARTVFCFVEKKPNSGPQLRIMQVDKPDGVQGGDFRLAPKDIPFPAQAVQMNDFPVSLVASPKHDMLFLITKCGYLYMYFIHTGSLIYSNRVTADTIFTTTVDSKTGGLLGVTARTGQVLSISVNENSIVKYCQSQVPEPGLALKVATILGLSGAGDMFKGEFERLMNAG